VDILPLLDELRTIALNGLHYTTDSYDRERYERLLTLVSTYYGQALDLPPAEARRRLAAEFGHITPKVGAEAAIFDDEGRILLSLRADDGLWGLPGGWSDALESPMETAVREAREETGLIVEPVRLVDVFSWRPSAREDVYAGVSVVYLCTVAGGYLSVSHESRDVRYMSIDAIAANEWHHRHGDYARAASSLWQGRPRRPGNPT